MKTLKEYRRYQLELSNILKAHDESLESLNSIPSEFCGIYDLNGHWKTKEDVIQAVLENNSFYTESEFIDFMLSRISDLKKEGFDPVEFLKEEADGLKDTTITYTGDGYVYTVYC